MDHRGPRRLKRPGAASAQAKRREILNLGSHGWGQPLGRGQVTQSDELTTHEGRGIDLIDNLNLNLGF